MCFRLARLLGFFKEDSQAKRYFPSLGDGLVPLSHEYDQELAIFFNHLKFDAATMGCNPTLENEVNHYQANAWIDKINMLNKNVMFQSRMFIRHALNNKLLDKTQDNTNLRILEIGLSFHILGVMTYFGKNKKVEYFCVDNDSAKVAQYKMIYHGLGLAFININPTEYLSSPATRTYDVVIIHNENLMELANNVLSEHGFVHTYEAQVFDRSFLDDRKSKKMN